MSAHCDFTEQTSSGENRPDLVVKLPGDRFIIVDAKVPDFDFLNALETAEPVKRAEALAAHAAKLKATIKALADRDYPRQFPNALDYVVLFVPAESLFSAALEGDHDLIVWAAEKRILLATPASLIALLRSVSVSWQQHAQTENAQKIAEAAQEFYARVVKFTEHFEKIRVRAGTGEHGLQRRGGEFSNARASGRRAARGTRRGQFGERIAGGSAAGFDVALAAGMISGMIRSCANISFSFPPCIFPLNSVCPRKHAAGFRLAVQIRAMPPMTAASRTSTTATGRRFRFRTTGAGKNAQAGKGLLSRAGLVSARTGRHAGSRQTIFSAVRGGEPGGGCLFERQIAGRTSRRFRRVLL